MLEDKYPEDFEQLWKVWPRKPIGRSKKAPSYKAFAAAKKALGFVQKDIDVIQADIEKRIRDDKKWELGFVPMFSTYMNQRWWNEVYTKTRAEKSNGGLELSEEENIRRYIDTLKRRGEPIPDCYKHMELH